MGNFQAHFHLRLSNMGIGHRIAVRIGIDAKFEGKLAFGHIAAQCRLYDIVLVLFENRCIFR